MKTIKADCAVHLTVKRLSPAETLPCLRSGRSLAWMPLASAVLHLVEDDSVCVFSSIPGLGVGGKVVPH